jgi:predicted phosphodiesterase
MIKHINKLIQYSSDLHIEKGFNRIIIPKNPYLILSGDIGYPFQDSYKDFLLETSQKFDKIFIIAGNHEYDKNKNVVEINKKIENICNMRTNLFFLQQKTYKLCNENNIEIAGCTFWSTLPKNKYKYHLEDKEWLYDVINTNKNTNYIIATHHCPLFECLNIKYFNHSKYNKTNDYFATDQTNIIKNNNVKMWIHGHSHINKNITLHDTLIVSNQYGSFKNPLYGYNK